MLKKIFLFLFVSCFLLFVSSSYAIELNSPRFKIEMENIDIDTQENKQPVIYTIKSLYGAGAFEEFNSYGHVTNQLESDKPLTFSLSNSLITFSDAANANPQDKTIDFSLSIGENFKSKVSLIQEYPLKNFSGETIDIYYSLAKENVFRKPPNQNLGDFPAVISDSKTESLSKIIFRINSPARPLEGTYDTIINFIASPDY